MSHLNAQIARLYDTVFDRAPDAEGLEFWNNAMHNGGLGLRDLANFFIAGPEFASTYGEPTTRGFVESLYQNILDRPGDAEGIIFWTNSLDAGLADRPQVVIGFSESAEHIQKMAENALVVGRPPPVPGSLVIAPDNGSHMLTGGAGNDTILGAAGNDLLSGMGGDNILNGSSGNDLLIGGPGNDTFVFSKGDGFDRIADFERGDKVLFLNMELDFGQFRENANELNGLACSGLSGPSH